MSQAGYLSGYSDNTFKPSAQITREQAAAIYGKVLQQMCIRDSFYHSQGFFIGFDESFGSPHFSRHVTCKIGRAHV